MQIDIITLFPSMFESAFAESIVGRALDEGQLTIYFHNPRDFATDKRKTVDGRPYGGGPGMVLRVDVIHQAIKAAKKNNPQAKAILLSPQGKVYGQGQAEKWAQNESGLILIAGHYEGFDERIRQFVDQEISIGQYVLTGGEIPAMVVVDSVARLLPGVLGDENSALTDSFSAGSELVGHPQYTRPDEYLGERVPSVLKSGNHQKIEEWRRERATEKTQAVS